MVFGTGFVEPGGTQAVLESIGALGLDGTTNFLDIGASLCGSARAITTSFGAYVTAMDLDADLVAAGLSQIRDVHLHKKVDVSILDLEHSGFRENRNAGTMIRNTLTYYYDKLALIDACAVSIKPGGQLLIEDRFLSYQSDTAPFEQWHAGEGVEIFPTDLRKARPRPGRIGAGRQIDQRHHHDIHVFAARRLGGFHDPYRAARNIAGSGRQGDGRNGALGAPAHPAQVRKSVHPAHHRPQAVGGAGRLGRLHACPRVDSRPARGYRPAASKPRKTPGSGSVAMKVLNSLKSAKRRDRACRVVRRRGRVYVINKKNPRFKARQG